MAEFVIERIVLAHHFMSPPGWVGDDYARTRRHHGIVYVLRGRAEYLPRDGSSFTVRAGDCLYMPSGTAYVTRCFEDEAFEHLTVNFDLLGGGHLFPGRQIVRFAAPAPFEQTFSALARHWALRHDFYRERCLSGLYEMTFLLLREAHAAPRQHHQRLAPARAYLDEHFQEDFPLSLLPGLCGLSPTYFHRLFREVFHETPADYRRRLRVARASDLLMGGLCTIGEAAALAGYSDPAYFSRMFRRTTGESPSRYLKRREE